MADDDLIRRGDALKCCQTQRRGSAVAYDIAALPAQGVRVPEGYVLVPVKMTADMINAWSGGPTVSTDEIAYHTPLFQDAWKRVLDAALPLAPAKAAENRISEVPFVDTYGDLPGDDAAEDNITAGRVTPVSVFDGIAALHDALATIREGRK